MKNQERAGRINVIIGFKGGVLLMGLSGSGKTQIAKGCAQFIHDFKYPDITKVAFNHFLSSKRRHKATPQFHILKFEDVQSRSNNL